MSAHAFPEALVARLPHLMREAILEARRADDPFGCAVADFHSGELILTAANSARSDPTGHAEMNALRKLAECRLGVHPTILISTAEPCPMCAAASWWAQVRGVVYGTSIADLIRFGWRQIDLPCHDLLARANPPSTMILLGGFLTEETGPLYETGPSRA